MNIQICKKCKNSISYLYVPDKFKKDSESCLACCSFSDEDYINDVGYESVAIISDDIEKEIINKLNIKDYNKLSSIPLDKNELNIFKNIKIINKNCPYFLEHQLKDWNK